MSTVELMIKNVAKNKCAVWSFTAPSDGATENKTTPTAHVSV